MSISTAAVHHGRRRLEFKEYGWLLFFLLFVFSAWHVAEPRFKISVFRRSRIPAHEELCRFDSFSEPSMATAILRQEADRLLNVYLQTDPYQLEFKPETPSPGDSSKSALEPCSIERCESIRAIQNLQKEVHALDSEMDRKLMVIYLQQRSWNNFLDCYLHFLQTEPQSAFVVIWTRSALVCSEDCGRTEEVLDALAHFTRFHRELKCTRLLTPMVDQWKSARANPGDDYGSVKGGD